MDIVKEVIELFKTLDAPVQIVFIVALLIWTIIKRKNKYVKSNELGKLIEEFVNKDKEKES